jgi:hypothetical protein
VTQRRPLARAAAVRRSAGGPGCRGHGVAGARDSEAVPARGCGPTAGQGGRVRESPTWREALPAQRCGAGRTRARRALVMMVGGLRSLYTCGSGQTHLCSHHGGKRSPHMAGVTWVQDREAAACLAGTAVQHELAHRARTVDDSDHDSDHDSDQWISAPRSTMGRCISLARTTTGSEPD